MSTRVLLVGAVIIVLATPTAAQEDNLLALGKGALPTSEPPSYHGWPAVHLLDDDPESGWACEEGRTTGNVFVFELAVPATFAAFEFDTAGIDGDGRGARQVTVEVSPTAGDAGFQQVLSASLADQRDGQRFATQRQVEGSWVRLTLVDNHGDAEWTELMSFRGYGKQGAAPVVGNLSGTYHTNYNDFHLRQQGTALIGCYEYQQGIFEGAVEGRVVKLTWNEENSDSGPAVFVFAPDGSSFRGYWWRGSDKGAAPHGNWDGTKASATVGGCPHWSGSVSGELRKDLAAAGRARLYGINFDVDSATIRAESYPTLDEVVTLMKAEAGWKIAIEGHTDSTGTAAHNQTLSEQRARSVRDYLVAKGVEASRLTATGFGQSRPVADNATELGRAQNRRVELVRD